jgi:hypothetical protein
VISMTPRPCIWYVLVVCASVSMYDERCAVVEL